MIPEEMQPLTTSKHDYPILTMNLNPDPKP